MALSIISRPVSSCSALLNPKVIAGIQQGLPLDGLQNSSYLYEFKTALGSSCSCVVTRYVVGSDVFVILTDPENEIGPCVSSNFASIATDLKSIDPLLEPLPAENIHWIEYRGPGSYNGAQASSFLLVIMHFNQESKHFERASWGHIFSLAKIILERQKECGGAPCNH